MFWFVCGKSELFPVLLHPKKVPCHQFAVSYSDFLLDFAQKNGITFLRRGSSFFS